MYLASSIAPHGSHRPELYDGLLSVQTFAVLNHHYNDGVTLDSFIDWMTEARYPMEHEPDYARATSTEPTGGSARSEEHKTELQSLMPSSYAVFCLKKNNAE